MASQAISELKSILKPTRSSHTTSPSTPSPAEAERIALAHARILQQQKDLELQILDAIDTLSTYPLIRSPTITSSNPSATDVAQFKSLIRPFQPSDYDDLIEERNILGSCGYALCPNKKRSDVRGEFTFINHNTPDFAIVPTRDVKKWCSDACARRALYVKVQLNETAAWERVAMPDVRIDLMDEPTTTTTTSSSKSDSKSAPGSKSKDEGEEEQEDLARDVAQLKLEEERKAKSVSTALSLERGDVLERGEKEKSRLVPLGPKMELTIREKEVKGEAKAPNLEEEGGGEDSVEGHVPRFRARSGAGSEDGDEDGDEDEGVWDL